MKSDEYIILNTRVKALEETLNDLITISNKFVSVKAIGKIITDMETEISYLKDRVTSLETRLESLEEEV